MARQWRDQQHRRLPGQAGGRVLAEVQQAAKGQLQHLALGDGHRCVTHLDTVDAIVGAAVGELEARENIHGGGHLAQRAALGPAEPERGRTGLRQHAKRRHQVGLGLVGLVEHGFPDVVNGWVTRLTALQASYGPADWHNPCDTVWSTPTTRSTPWPKPS
jgi:hypothetical protein